MTDIGSTTVGYVLAYLLPGLATAVGFGLASPQIGRIFQMSISQQNLVLGLMGGLGALAAGLFVSLFRELIFVELIARESRLTAEEHASLAEDDQTFKAYRALIDEIYRYHQFWGGMALALPILFGAVLWRALQSGAASPALIVSAFLVLEVTAVWAALTSYRRYVERARLILK